LKAFRGVEEPERSRGLLKKHLAKLRVGLAVEEIVVFDHLALLAFICVCGCSASGPEPTFETAYSAIGAQVK
jgi:hypothetical protein